MITNDTRGSHEIKSKTALAKAAINKKKTVFTSKLDLNLRKKLVKCYTWSTALYDAEKWTLHEVDQKYLESFEMWCWRRIEKISWTDHVRNEEVLDTVKERNILHTIKRRKAITQLVLSCTELPSKTRLKERGKVINDGKTRKKA
ncbi:hypothetical protein Cfor_06672 [Coptotermes formosanus]|jgi:hypothetical protein|uniref:Uncharacterized protein n=1 Tax=Coptotermes formosanus TaxID=36987 RepID=A0A6L2QC08_COPFO|nr:hypothetical protein Cfor_06672 [Coptotermes formosanus]